MPLLYLDTRSLRDASTTYSEMHEYREPVINAKIFANEFQKLTRDFRPPIKESDTRLNRRIAVCNENIIDFLSRTKKCADRGRCDIKSFKEQVIKSNGSFLMHIEIWWYLKKCGIMRDEDFYEMFDSADCQHIADHLSTCLCKSISLRTVNSQLRENMNSDFIELFLKHKENCCAKKTESSIYQNFLSCLSCCINTDNKQGIMTTESVVEILEMTSVKNSVMKLFLLDIVEMILQGEPLTLEALLTKTEHFIKNENMTDKNKSKILQLLDFQDIILHLQRIFTKNYNQMNWQNLFYLLSCMTFKCEDNLKHLKGLILTLLNDALENFNKNSLLYVFVLARYFAFPRVPNFPSYLNWFASTFSSESSRPINTKEKAVFLMNFLNETVELDSPYYLKVHINRVPCLPMDCQSLVSDYVKLVKTRLTDLNESAELGLFDNISIKSSAEFDVETVLSMFSNTNEVPKCVLEASIFYRAYYEKKFLVTLLSKFEGKNSVRHRLIIKLQSLGKIPNSLFLNYKQLI